jgi:hypothetical protein
LVEQVLWLGEVEAQAFLRLLSFFFGSADARRLGEAFAQEFLRLLSFFFFFGFAELLSTIYDCRRRASLFAVAKGEGEGDGSAEPKKTEEDAHL